MSDSQTYLVTLRVQATGFDDARDSVVGDVVACVPESMAATEPGHTTLPAQLVESTVERMKVGEYGYTVPWALSADNDGQAYLNPNYTIQTNTGGTVQMRVERRSDGFHVWPTERVSKSDSPFGGTSCPVVWLHS